MAHEPDWESLDQLQFLLLRRVVEPLNAALAAISLLHLDSAADKPRAYWQERATNEVMGTLNLINAWHALIRFKLGELLPQQHIRPFYVQEMLDWLAYQLQLVNPLHAEKNLLIEANRESLQEALLLLYSAAYTLGPSVRLIVQNTTDGMWFRVRYAKVGPAPCNEDLDALIQRLSGNWRLEDTAFELRTAADFIALNGSQLHLQGSEQSCEMAFFVYTLGRRPANPLSTAQVTEPPALQTSDSEEILYSTLVRPGTDSSTRQIPPQILKEIDALSGEGQPPAPPAAQANGGESPPQKDNR